MRYINSNDIKKMGENWNETIECIEKAVWALEEADYSQPIKPYLRYKDPVNRIIAMPAYVGKDVNSAGIKWIASFPKNIKKDIPRANCVVVLNNADTGVVESILNTSLVSAIRTASVSGLILKYYLKNCKKDKLRVGIIGWGPIGQHHYRMTKSVLNNRLEDIYVYDLNKDRIVGTDDTVKICDSWQELYLNCDVIMTCTVSDAPYIDLKPQEGALLLNVSLRDYKNDVFEYVKNSIIVDDWEEVCRENTDIERLHDEMGLNEEMVYTIKDVVCHDVLSNFTKKDNVMFNPMGMAVFDIAICKYFYLKALKEKVGVELE